MKPVINEDGSSVITIFIAGSPFGKALGQNPSQEREMSQVFLQGTYM